MKMNVLEGLPKSEKSLLDPKPKRRVDKRMPAHRLKRGRPGYVLSKKIGRAICDYDMIQDKDKILVGVSGGKDSLTLLKMLNDRRSFVPVSYEVSAIHIDFGYHCTPPHVLAGYFKREGYDYHIKKVQILKEGQTRADVTCFWCSWNRRKAIFKAAAELGCNKVALGHHKNDIIQTTLMNLFYLGEISTMRPKQKLFNGKLALIRPLAYADEKEINEFAATLNYPLPHCKCPNSFTSKRTYVRKLIAGIQKDCPQVKSNIFNALKRVKKDYLL